MMSSAAARITISTIRTRATGRRTSGNTCPSNRRHRRPRIRSCRGRSRTTGSRRPTVSGSKPRVHHTWHSMHRTSRCAHMDLVRADGTSRFRDTRSRRRRRYSGCRCTGCLGPWLRRSSCRARTHRARTCTRSGSYHLRRTETGCCRSRAIRSSPRALARTSRSATTSRHDYALASSRDQLPHHLRVESSQWTTAASAAR